MQLQAGWHGGKSKGSGRRDVDLDAGPPTY